MNKCNRYLEYALNYIEFLKKYENGSNNIELIEEGKEHEDYWFNCWGFKQ